MPDDSAQQPHDALFKIGFSEPKTAASFLTQHLPLELSSVIDWGKLTLLNGNFIDNHLRESESDLLFSAPLAGNQALLYVLFEHQSTEDPTIALRLLRYMVRIWERFAREHKPRAKLPVILPVVLAQSTRQWKVSPQFSALFEIPKGAEPFLPQFEFRLVQLSQMPYTKLAGTPEATLVLRLLKAAAEADLLGEEVWDEELLDSVS